MHYDCEDTGYAVLLLDQRSGVVIGVHVNTGNAREAFDECRTGLTTCRSACGAGTSWRRGRPGWMRSGSSTPGLARVDSERLGEEVELMAEQLADGVLVGRRVGGAG